MTIQKAAEQLCVAYLLIVKWKKQWRAGGGGGDPIIAFIKSKKKATHARPLGQSK